MHPVIKTAIALPPTTASSTQPMANPYRPYNRVNKVRPRLRRLRGLRFRVVRYEATFYHSGYGMGSVSAFTERKCNERFRRLCGEFFADAY